jgi:hypothetical protein
MGSGRKTARPRAAERQRIARQLEESQDISRELLETAAQGILVVDLEERIVRTNDAAAKMFGYTRRELMGKKLGMLIPEDLRETHSQHVAGYFDKPRRRVMGVGMDLAARRKDGSQIPVEISLSHVRMDDRPLAVAFVSDITLRKKSEREIADHRGRLQRLTKRLITAAEDETRRWARELHDVYSQRLASLSMKLDRLNADQPEDSPYRAVEADVRSLADDVHGMSRRMHPSILHDLGLAAALRSELAGFEREHGIKVALRAEGVPRGLPADVALCLYRVAQEALTNIRKHSRAQRVELDLAGSDGTVTMAIRDEGRGFDLELMAHRGGMGLMSMEERVNAVGGEFSIESSSGKGTAVRVQVPLNNGN